MIIDVTDKNRSSAGAVPSQCDVVGADDHLPLQRLVFTQWLIQKRGCLQRRCRVKSRLPAKTASEWNVVCHEGWDVRKWIGVLDSQPTDIEAVEDHTQEQNDRTSQKSA